MTPDQLLIAIAETAEQEKLFRLAGDHLSTAWWVMERVKLRGQLFDQLLQNIKGDIHP